MSFKPFKSVGIGVTFSPNLKANIYEASRLSLMFNSKLILIHVGEETAEKKDTFTNILAPFLNQNLSVDIIFKSGNPVDVILSVSQNKNIDLLILGALKKEKLVNYYLGSIARKITRKSNCSILLLINPSIERIACQNIVVNGLKDPKTEQAIESAFYISHCLGSKMVTIVEEINQDEVAIKVEDDKSLRKATILKERIKLRETTRIKSIVEHIPKEHTDLVTIKSQPIFGKKGYSIGHYAQISRADLLVMNAPSKTTIWDRIFPHDIEHILAELPTDVLIIQ
ncbi:universal stress protein [Xanthomarina spongicola]|uniref:Universal stress protein family protein n=1 Tax=Xanthomarina spongicola TaxID=570520 RepID=A0A316DRR9_9FLAO|nr:universal stress protein [Xanthomarina spongicola]PWK20526.1 universal stress protein family protein [Xanthomarina spongicola]